MVLSQRALSISMKVESGVDFNKWCSICPNLLILDVITLTKSNGNNLNMLKMSMGLWLLTQRAISHQSISWQQEQTDLRFAVYVYICTHRPL